MFTITTPAILFPAISLILLAYTTKFIHLGGLVRNLKNQYQKNKSPNILSQLLNIRRRIYLIRSMQALGIASFACSVMCMLLLFGGYIQVAAIVFSLSLLFLLSALALSVWEIIISAEALKTELEDLGHLPKNKKGH
ncbi:DUF2721 domain-containing protein [Pedobacter sp. SYSU D00535]|uniref:DUF2721 domain-containing protein n=1 Tax=Pedobacter sp. SYSU D00535 TaxID=2810308 RepID=UPI001A979768|nr:DUF2721 domain-containing protein [Pedobacter sp. SYSU D00535]